MTHQWTETEEKTAKRYVLRAENVREILAEAIAATLEEFERLLAVNWPDGILHVEPARDDFRHFAWERENSDAVLESLKLLDDYPRTSDLRFLPIISAFKSNVPRS